MLPREESVLLKWELLCQWKAFKELWPCLKELVACIETLIILQAPNLVRATIDAPCLLLLDLVVTTQVKDLSLLLLPKKNMEWGRTCRCKPPTLWEVNFMLYLDLTLLLQSPHGLVELIDVRFWLHEQEHDCMIAWERVSESFRYVERKARILQNKKDSILWLGVTMMRDWCGWLGDVSSKLSLCQVLD